MASRRQLNNIVDEINQDINPRLKMALEQESADIIRINLFEKYHGQWQNLCSYHLHLANVTITGQFQHRGLTTQDFPDSQRYVEATSWSLTQHMGGQLHEQPRYATLAKIMVHLGITECGGRGDGCRGD